jgi:predicted PP-loop superfamily ATPase
MKTCFIVLRCTPEKFSEYSTYSEGAVVSSASSFQEAEKDIRSGALEGTFYICEVRAVAVVTGVRATRYEVHNVPPDTSATDTRTEPDTP